MMQFLFLNVPLSFLTLALIFFIKNVWSNLSTRLLVIRLEEMSSENLITQLLLCWFEQSNMNYICQIREPDYKLAWNYIPSLCPNTQQYSIGRCWMSGPGMRDKGTWQNFYSLHVLMWHCTLSPILVILPLKVFWHPKPNVRGKKGLPRSELIYLEQQIHRSEKVYAPPIHAIQLWEDRTH